MDIHDEHDAVAEVMKEIEKQNKLATELRKQLDHELVVLNERSAVSRHCCWFTFTLVLVCRERRRFWRRSDKTRP